jgi:ABC-type dipeptide/oligopeptide/nickel transport system permease subunit
MVMHPQEEELRETTLARETSGETFEAGAALNQTSLWRDAFRRFTHNRAAVIAAIAFAILVLYVVITPWIVPYDPNEVDFSVAYKTPTWAHPFGTDQFGRDLFLRDALDPRTQAAA